MGNASWSVSPRLSLFIHFNSQIPQMQTDTMTKDEKSSDIEMKTSLQLEPAESYDVGRLTDEQRLAQLGHSQELARRFSLPALGALCLCLMATWEALSTVLASALISGGPPCLFYN